MKKCIKQSEKTYSSLFSSKENKKKGPNFKAILACSLAVCFILVAAVLLFKFPIRNSSSPSIELENIHHYQINKTTDNSSLSASAKSSECADAISNSMNKADKRVFTPDVKLLSNIMELDSSSKPGLPITVGLSKDDKDNYNIKAINISVDYGTFLKWNRKTGVTSLVGPLATIDSEETFYWTPLDGSDTSGIKNITILIEAVAKDTVIGSRHIYVTQYEMGCYSATIEEPKVS